MSADTDFSSERPEPRAIPITEWAADDRARVPRVRIAPHFYGLSLGLFAATCLTTFFVGTLPIYGDSATNWFQNGLQYSAGVMTILLCHEMGHYLQSLRYGIPATPPLFIPMPFFPFGTMGAVIIQQAGVGNRRQIFDVAVSGPLAGLVATIPILYLGLSHAELADPEIYASKGGNPFGDPLLLTWMAEWLMPPNPTGLPIQLNPLLHAGWLGVFITALNLFPIGQLDGGHILYTLIRRHAHVVAQSVVLGAGGWMFVTGNYSYLLMLVLISFFGLRHRRTADDTVSIGWFRATLGWATLSFLFVGFTPVPLAEIEPPDVPAAVQPESEPDPFPRRPLRHDEIEV